MLSLVRKTLSVVLIGFAALTWTLALMTLAVCILGLIVDGTMGWAVGGMVAFSIMGLADAVGECL